VLRRSKHKKINLQQSLAIKRDRLGPNDSTQDPGVRKIREYNIKNSTRKYMS